MDAVKEWKSRVGMKKEGKKLRWKPWQMNKKKSDKQDNSSRLVYLTVYFYM